MAHFPAFDPLRIGAVQYFNSKPLIEGLGDLLPSAEFSLDFPSRLADDLADGMLDVALIPSIESFRDPAYEVISDACVATRGPVLSVKLYSRVPIQQISRLALDTGSRTSAALVQILLSERYGVTPDVEPLPMSCPVECCTADAMLLIGDRALHTPQERFHIMWDLGEEWRDWTGLPFVFALWVCRKGTATTALRDALGKSRDRGVASLQEIAAREANALSLNPLSAFRYLRENLHFHLGFSERRGLELFHHLAVNCGLVSPEAALVH